MELLLMHKDIRVMRFTLDENNSIKNIVELYNREHMPFSTEGSSNNNLFKLKEWWNDRCIPVTRDNYSEAFQSLPEDDSLSLVVKSNGLSLTDQYWIKKTDEDIRYDDISFFSNKFSNDIGDIFIGKKRGKTISYYSPDSTSTGNLKKRWKIINGKRYLLKAGTKPHQYEIFNEIIASKIMDLLDIDHVDYELTTDEGMLFCRSLNFVYYNEDFISAYQLFKSENKQNNVSYYNHFLSILKKIGLEDYEMQIEQMLFIDYLLGNTDRHLHNFGVIRDAKTLEFVRVAPIFDTGACLGYNLSDDELGKLEEVDWMPFKSKKNPNQLSLIEDYFWIKFDILQAIPFQINELLKQYSNYISDKRRKAIVSFLTRRINMIFRYFNIEKELSDDDVELTSLEQGILNYMKSHNNRLDDLRVISTKYGVVYLTAYRAIRSLVSKRLVRRSGATKNGCWILL